MKTIGEIFKNRPELLEEPEVKELVEQFKFQFNTIKKRKMDYWDKVTKLTMNSEFFVIDGTSCKDTVAAIHDLSFQQEHMF
jgi:5-methylcytosine-specific restriction endonuclease McrBC GTP-binding regulatory subunit McrB